MRKGLFNRQLVVFGPILDQILFLHLTVLGLPTLLYCWILQSGWNLWALQQFIAVLYLLTAFIVLSETTVMALCQTPKFDGQRQPGLVQRNLQSRHRTAETSNPQPQLSRRSLPRCSMIVVAYLPNEQQIIIETLTHILSYIERPPAGLEVILAYNSPIRLPVEDDLQRLAREYPELRLLYAKRSKSKAENLNAAVKLATGEITCIFDADHLPQPGSLDQAWQWLAQGSYDVVQGRNMIRNANCNFLTRMIAVEFDCLYGVSHSAKSLLVDTAMFCGSNGYWLTAVLRRMRFHPRVMTEDVDVTLQTLLTGYRIVHDPTIVATELAPVDLKSFWSQRKRWAQGWLEVTVKYQWRLLRSAQLDGWQKLYWTLLMLYSTAFPFIALQFFPISFSLMLNPGSTPILTHNFISLVATLLIVLSGPYQAWVAIKLKNQITCNVRLNFMLYCIAMPVFCILKNIISIAAAYDYLRGNHEWVVTRRSPQKPTPTVVYAKQVHR